MSGQQTPPGWYHAEGDPAGSTRWWDGSQWVGEPQVTQATDFGAPSQDFGTPSQDFGAPPQNFGPPPQDFGAPPQNFGPPPQGFGTTARPGQYRSSGAFEMISPGSRIGGRVLDWIVWFFIVLVVSVPLLASADTAGFEVGGPNSVPEALSTLLATALIVAYETFGNVKGGTLGKRATSARVVKADGSPLDLATSFRRMWLYVGLTVLGFLPIVALFANFVLIVLAVVALIMLSADERNQTPWDKIAGTIVVSKRR